MKVNIIIVILGTLSTMPIKSQTKADIPNDLSPSSSVVMKTENGTMVIGTEDDLYENGNMKSSGMHTADNKKTGKWYYFREDGSVENITFYVDGKNTGKAEWFDSNNILIESGYFENDIHVKTWNTYHSSGKIKMTGEYINGKREGRWPVFNEEGILIDEVEFLNGEKHGLEKIYFETKNIQTEVTWKNGSLDGPCIQYHSNGKVKMKGQHLNGDKTGHWTIYNEDGTISREVDI